MKKKLIVNPVTGKLDYTLDVTGSASKMLIKDANGDLISNEHYSIRSDNGALELNTTATLNDDNSGHNVESSVIGVTATIDSPNDFVVANQVNINLDANNTGFNIGGNGNSLFVQNSQVNHNGTADVGNITFSQQNAIMGNGTDAVQINGISFTNQYTDIKDNVTVTGPIQGIGFQPNVEAGAVIQSTSYTNGFYDTANVLTPSSTHTSFQSSPHLSELQNSKVLNGVSVNPTVDTLTGNASVNGVAIGGEFGAFDTGNYQGVNVNPTIPNIKNANGINVDMSNVVPHPGAGAEAVIQDLTYSSVNNTSDLNSVTIEYVSDVTSGSEFIDGSFPNYIVHIESGVTTADDIKTVVDGFGQFAGQITVAVSGTGTNTQVTNAPVTMSGGQNPGSVLAANFNGNVHVDGAITFNGALSTGRLNAYGSYELQAQVGGSVGSVHSIISGMNVAANQSVADADTIGVNTAGLINLGDDATVTTSFLGVSALGLPAVVTMGAGSTIDKVNGAVFAVSLDNTSTGGTVAELNLCNALGLPNGGTTSIDSLKGYKMEMPFGNDGIGQMWGVYIAPTTAENFMAGSLVIGSNDTVLNSSVGLELSSTSKAILNPRMTTAQRDALNATDGMQIYNTTINKFQVHNNGAWVTLADAGSLATVATTGQYSDLIGAPAAGANTTLSNLSTTDINLMLGVKETVTGPVLKQKALTSSGHANPLEIAGQDANGTDKRGANIVLRAGRDTGGVGGSNWRQGPELEFWTNNSTTSGSSLATQEQYLRLTPTLLQGVDFQVGSSSNGFFSFQSLVDSGTPGVSGDTSRILFGHASRGGMIKSVIQGITNGAGNGGDLVLKPGIGSTQDGNITCQGVGVVFPPLSADPTGVTGMVYYNTTTNKLRCYNGSTWNDLF